jgi:hypothetical protein
VENQFCIHFSADDTSFNTMAESLASDVFNSKWILKCAIVVTERDPMMCKPVTAVCNFCKTIAKDEQENKRLQRHLAFQETMYS